MKFTIIIAVLLKSLLAISATKSTLKFSSVCQGQNCYNLTNGKDLHLSESKLDSTSFITYLSDPFNGNVNCVAKNNCYLFLGAVGDSFDLSINEHKITNLIDENNNYIAHSSIVIPIPSEFFKEENNIIKINVKDLNNYNWGLLNKNIFLSEFNIANIISLKDWLIRTGFTIFSAYFLVLFSLLGILTFFALKMKNALYISLYCLISCLYLISFSEIPRQYLDPNTLSGLIHFPLRLLQDATLCFVFHSILNKRKDFKYFYRSLSVLYFLVIGEIGRASCRERVFNLV